MSSPIGAPAPVRVTSSFSVLESTLHLPVETGHRAQGCVTSALAMPVAFVAVMIQPHRARFGTARISAGRGNRRWPALALVLGRGSADGADAWAGPHPNPLPRGEGVASATKGARGRSPRRILFGGNCVLR